MGDGVVPTGERWLPQHRLVPAVLLAGLLAGCGEGDSQKLRQWTFAVDEAAARPVTLPVHLPGLDRAPPRPRESRLQRTVELPPAWRGQPLTLTCRGRPVLRLEPLQATRRDRGDPFYALAELADKRGASLTNEQIDEIVYGS